jgi:beta-phosphoglucomutase-like phosphatase (HAD superfamily)
MSIIEAVIDSQGWHTLIPQRCSAEGVARGKPAPDVYLLAAQTLKLAPGDCLALEDSVNGARAAVAAGMTCFAVPDPSHVAASAFAGVTPHIFDNLDSVLAHLANGG